MPGTCRLLTERHQIGEFENGIGVSIRVLQEPAAGSHDGRGPEVIGVTGHQSVTEGEKARRNCLSPVVTATFRVVQDAHQRRLGQLRIDRNICSVLFAWAGTLLRSHRSQNAVPSSSGMR